MKVLVLVSGGMDSVTVLHWAAREHELVGAISFDYGAKHNHRELPFAAQHAKELGIRHEIVALDFIDRLFNSSLLKSGGDVPTGEYGNDNMKSTVVPFRNAIMLSIACGFAESIGAEGLAIGAHGGDHVIYPDCRPEFMKAMGDAISFGTYANITLLCPFQDTTKGGIVKAGIELGLDYAQTYSCYKGGEIQCGECGTCRERWQACEEAGIQDPTIYLVSPGAATKESS
ncbi:exsB protein [Pavlovales sp. CCMP2436]|nr:exsB protein [Pavlovales sp. CCMP2436]